MSGRYYGDDTEERKKYFDRQFLSNAKILAENNSVTLSAFLSTIQDFSDFKKALKLAWSLDSSLLSYYEGMGDSELLEFYNREVIQNILNRNVEKAVEGVPSAIIQENKRNKELFRGRVKGRTTFAYRDEVRVRGKSRQIYRDSRGRFASIR